MTTFTRRNILPAVLAVASVLTAAPLAAQNQPRTGEAADQEMMEQRAERSAQNRTQNGNATDSSLLQHMEAMPELNTLTQLVRRAGLSAALSEGGPYTILAPTNEAFQKLNATNAQFVRSDQRALRKTLRNHIIRGLAPSELVRDMEELPTMANRDVDVSVLPGGTKINGATITVPDIVAGNGIIHVIDRVLVPETDKSESIVALITGDERYSTLSTLIQNTELSTTLADAGPFTLFAPTDEAFAQLSREERTELTSNEARLQRALEYHVLSGEFTTQNLPEEGSRESITGDMLNLGFVDGTTVVNSAEVVQPDIQAANGVIHGIDRVLTPETDTAYNPREIEMRNSPATLRRRTVSTWAPPDADEMLRENSPAGTAIRGEYDPDPSYYYDPNLFSPAELDTVEPLYEEEKEEGGSEEALYEGEFTY